MDLHFIPPSQNSDLRPSTKSNHILYHYSDKVQVLLKTSEIGLRVCRFGARVEGKADVVSYGGQGAVVMVLGVE